MAELTQMKCVACRRDAPRVTDAEIAEYLPQTPQWEIVERENIKRLERVFKFDDFPQALSFTNKVGELAEAEGHHPAPSDRMGKSNGHVVDSQNTRIASQRLHRGGKDGPTVWDLSDMNASPIRIKLSVLRRMLRRFNALNGAGFP